MIKIKNNIFSNPINFYNSDCNNLYRLSQDWGFMSGYNQAIYEKTYNLGYEYAMRYDLDNYSRRLLNILEDYRK